MRHDTDRAYVGAHPLLRKAVSVDVGGGIGSAVGVVGAIYREGGDGPLRAEVALDPARRDEEGNLVVGADRALNACRPIVSYVGPGPIPPACLLW